MSYKSLVLQFETFIKDLTFQYTVNVNELHLCTLQFVAARQLAGYEETT